MSLLYVATHGARVHKRGERLVVEAEGAPPQEVEARTVTGVVAVHTVHFTTQTLAELLECGVPLSIVTGSGKLLGQLVPPLGNQTELRRAQMLKESDPAFCLAQARSIVAAKLENQRQVLLRYAMDRLDLPALSQAADEILAAARQAETADNMDSLRGFEGLAARAYWGVFGSLLSAEGVRFTGRRAHPSPDPVNAVLSFGYVLLNSILHNDLAAAGFDPHLGFLHEESYGRPSLALDLLESFRAPVVDRMTVRLFNLRMLRPGDFESEGEGVRLKADPLKVFFREWERTLAKHSVRSEVRACVANLREVFTSGAPLSPWRWSARK